MNKLNFGESWTKSPPEKGAVDVSISVLKHTLYPLSGGEYIKFNLVRHYVKLT